MHVNINSPQQVSLLSSFFDETHLFAAHKQVIALLIQLHSIHMIEVEATLTEHHQRAYPCQHTLLGRIQ
jgi:hypothetical protein